MASNPSLLASGPKRLPLFEELVVSVTAPLSFQLCSAGDRTVKLLALRAMTMLFSFRFGSFKINTIHCTRNAGWVPSKLTGFEEGPPATPLSQAMWLSRGGNLHPDLTLNSDIS